MANDKQARVQFTPSKSGVSPQPQWGEVGFVRWLFRQVS